MAKQKKFPQNRKNWDDGYRMNDDEMIINNNGN